MASVAGLKTNPQTDEDRSSRRHRLWLSTRVSARGQADQVLIHNLSTTGLLFESTLELSLGDNIEVELPEAGTTQAEVVWCNDSFYGCEFASPVPAAAVSASRLRSPSPQPAMETYSPLAASELHQAYGNDDDPRALSPLQKTIIVGGLAVACWIPIILAVVLL